MAVVCVLDAFTLFHTAESTYKRTFYHHLDQIYSLGEGTLMGVGSLLF